MEIDNVKVTIKTNADEEMNKKTERQKWKEELKKEMREKRKEPNGFQYFTLGFAICALVVAIITKLQ